MQLMIDPINNRQYHNHLISAQEPYLVRETASVSQDWSASVSPVDNNLTTSVNQLNRTDTLSETSSEIYNYSTYSTDIDNSSRNIPTRVANSFDETNTSRDSEIKSTTSCNIDAEDNNINKDNSSILVDLASSYTRMNIQPTSFTKNHLISNGALSGADGLSMKKRREDLSRRPSYRKIYNDLTGGPLDSNPQLINPVGHLAPPSAPHRNSPQHIVSNNQTQIASASPSPQALDLLSNVGLSSNSSTNIQDPSVGARQSPVSVVDLQTAGTATNQPAQQQLLLQHQHPSQQQTSHQHQHHHLPPPSQTTNHHQQQPGRHHQHHHQHQQHQQHHHPHQQQQQPQHSTHHQHASQLQQVHHMLNTTSPPISSGVVVGEEATKKRELRLQKNREAAKECRRKKKEYIKCLENRVAVLENQNKALIDELKTLKDLYCKSTNE